jgi:3-hydroxyacyl-CoA dehydrogenase/enoyl-CoA hydratase/3-hydroxybutyryl-CoA epimerase/3-hydroxyacyl-CoA dehydrogenase/enoyl-CoA hydratase/3-hydroxybutyryl-CoA epimerase/enoyl-CoA isomerase
MSESPTITLSLPESDIALLTLDAPGSVVNLLTPAVLTELEQILDALQPRSDMAGLVFLSGKPGSFLAGADVTSLATRLDTPREQTVLRCQRGQEILARLAEFPGATVAAIDGPCLGGGAELAVWCDRRVMSDDPRSELRFPEVELGLHPGWGGTARLPRLVGLSAAVSMITEGLAVAAGDARQMGLTSDVVPAESLLAAAVNLVRAEQLSGQFRCDRRKWRAPLTIRDHERAFLAWSAGAALRRKTRGLYPAPEAALDLLLKAASLDVTAACRREVDSFASLFGSPVNTALLNVYFLNARNKRDRGVDRDDLVPTPIQSVGVIGAGIMGTSVAVANIRGGLPVTIMDANQTALDRGIRQVMEELCHDPRTGPSPAERAIAVGPRLSRCRADEELARCELVLETVVENAEVKKSIYARLESKLDSSTILATNTSTITISSLAQNMRHPERFCGIHFFNPVRRMKLVEVIRGPQTSDQTVATAVAYAKQIGKSPIVVNDGPGFLVNRLLSPYMNESLALVQEGASLFDIDRAARHFGMRMGPISLYDVVGLDTAFYAGRTMWEAFPDRVYPSPVLPALIKAGRLGQKSGAGFFAYHKPSPRGVADPRAVQLIEPYLTSVPRPFTLEELTNRLFLPMLLEATRVLDEHIVRDARDIDLGLIFGLGFPACRGGLLFWADQVGIRRLLEMLKPLEHLGSRMQPTPLLQRMAAEGGTFYDS